MTAATIQGSMIPTNEPTRRELFTDVVRSEWTKIRTVRSTFWTLFAAVFVMIAIAAIAGLVTANGWNKMNLADRAKFNAVEVGVAGAFFAQLAIGVLGVLVMTTEYGTGMIRATFGAVPQRRYVLWAKAAVFTAVSLVVGIVSSFIAFFVGQATLATHAGDHLSVSITSPGALRGVIGAGVFLAAMGLLGLALGAVIRRSAGAITGLFALVFFLPGLLQLLPSSIKDNLNKYLPSNAGSAIYRQVSAHDVLSPGAGLAVLVAWGVIALAVAAYFIQRRDA